MINKLKQLKKAMIEKMLYDDVFLFRFVVFYMLVIMPIAFKIEDLLR